MVARPMTSPCSYLCVCRRELMQQAAPGNYSAVRSSTGWTPNRIKMRGVNSQRWVIRGSRLLHHLANAPSAGRKIAGTNEAHQSGSPPGRGGRRSSNSYSYPRQALRASNHPFAVSPHRRVAVSPRRPFAASRLCYLLFAICYSLSSPPAKSSPSPHPARSDSHPLAHNQSESRYHRPRGRSVVHQSAVR
jgi:hypothetical protein